MLKVALLLLNTEQNNIDKNIRIIKNQYSPRLCDQLNWLIEMSTISSTILMQCQ